MTLKNRLFSDNIPDKEKNYVIVDSLEDLPPAIANVIVLEANTTYFFTTTIDLLGAMLICGPNTTIIGGSSENSRIKSTGLLYDPLISSNYSLPMRNITLEAELALNLDAGGNPNQAIDWFGVNFTDCTNIGTIANYSNVIWTDCAVLNSANLIFDGTTGTVGFNQSIFDGRSGQTTITFSEGLTITRRIRFTSCPFVVLSGETGINLSILATIPVEGYRCHFGDFSGGGTYLAGVQSTDNKALFTETKGVQNSAAIANYYMTNNATVTDIISQGVAVKIAGTTNPGSLAQKFTFDNNRATYTGAITRDFKVTAVVTVIAATANKQLGLYVRKNTSLISESEQYVTTNANSRAEAITIQAFVNLSTNDYIEIWVENDTDNTDITCSFLNVIIEAQN